MKTRQSLLLGLAGIGFVLAVPAYADPSSVSASGFVLAKRDDHEARGEFRREPREEQQRFRGRNEQMRDGDRPAAPRDYGYGYERRHQPHPTRDDERGRR